VADEKRMKTHEWMDAGSNNAQTNNKRKMKKKHRDRHINCFPLRLD